MKTQHNKNRIAAICASICICVFSLAAAIWISCLQQQPVPNAMALQADMNDSILSSGETGISNDIKVPGYDTVYFPENSQNVPITLYNPAGNICNFVFELYLNDDASPIYISDLVPPGKAVTEITLFQPLVKGSFLLQIKIKTYDITTGGAMNTALVKTTLIVD